MQHCIQNFISKENAGKTSICSASIGSERVQALAGCHGEQFRWWPYNGDGAVSGWFRYPRFVTQSGRIAGWLVTSSPWNRDEDYDTVVNSEKGSYDIVG